MNYKEVIMSHIPENSCIYSDQLFQDTKLKNQNKFNYYLKQLNNEGFISIGTCNDIILNKPKEHFYQYSKKMFKEKLFRWLPIIISFIALIKSFAPQLALVWKLIVQL